jgi:hypothetical protein
MTRDDRAAYQRDYRARKQREAAEAGMIELRPPSPKPPAAHTGRPSFLAAPDDDCATCGHDRQATHAGGGRCGYSCICQRFRPAGTPLVPCMACGHDEYHGHAANPCTQWVEPGRCGCPAFLDAEDLF